MVSISSKALVGAPEALGFKTPEAPPKLLPRVKGGIKIINLLKIMLKEEKIKQKAYN